jgi:hypothetical protein
LLALISSPGPLGTNELVNLTGWCEASVNAGLHKLELLGWVERLARYNGWSLVRQVRLSVIPRLFSVEEPSPSLDPDSDGNHKNLCSLSHEESKGVQDPIENPVIQGTAVHEQTHPFPVLTGNRKSYGSDLPPGSLQTLIDRANDEIYCSPFLSASGFYGRRYPLRKKHPANRKNFGSRSQEEEVNLNRKTQTLSSSDSDSTPPPENGPPGCQDPLLSPANVGKILAATRQLFGERVMGAPKQYPDPVRLLAAIAEAYQNRHALRKPARVVFKNLKNETDISPEYLEDPLSYLPESFLQAAGLPQPSTPAKSVYARYLEGLPAEESFEEGESLDSPALSDPHPSLSHRAGDHPTRTAVEAWTMAKSILESQVELGVYQKFFARACLACYDSASNTFTVTVEDALARDWLRERSTRLVERLLVGICNRPATVLFVTCDPVVEE